MKEENQNLIDICQQALEYNNSNRLQESVDLLLSVADEGQYNAIWNYYLGYAQLYLGKKEEARTLLLKARALHPLIPIESILPDCLCADGVPADQVDNDYLLARLSELVGSAAEDGAVRIPETDILITLNLDQMQSNDAKTMFSAVLSLWFSWTGQEDTVYDCAVGLGAHPKDALNNAFLNFYIGVYAMMRNVVQNQSTDQLVTTFGGKEHRWKVYRSGAIQMGQPLPVTDDFYWDILKEDLPNYLGNQRIVPMKVYNSHTGTEIIAECRLNDIIAQDLTKKLSAVAETWENERFTCHKQFYLLVQEEETFTPYPYTQAEIDQFTQTAVEIFADPEIDYDDAFERLTEKIHDRDLCHELFSFIPELSAAQAFEQVKISDLFTICLGENENDPLFAQWQITAYHRISQALYRGFRGDSYPENSFSRCVSVSSMYNAICSAKEQGTDIENSPVSMHQRFSFPPAYCPR